MLCSDPITVEIGRENETVITLGNNSSCGGPCVTIPPESISRVVLRIDDIILDTDNGSLSFFDERRAISAKIGLIGLDACEIYAGLITVYDDLAHVHGLAWARVLIQTVPWPGPEVDD